MLPDQPPAPGSEFELRALSAAEVSELHQAQMSAKSKGRNAAQAQKRGQYFLRGPLPFDFIQRVIPDAASRVVLIALAFMDMARADECVLGQKVWGGAGIKNHDQRRRVLARLRKMSPTLEILDRKGRPSLLRIRPSSSSRSTPRRGSA